MTSDDVKLFKMTRLAKNLIRHIELIESQILLRDMTRKTTCDALLEMRYEEVRLNTLHYKKEIEDIENE